MLFKTTTRLNERTVVEMSIDAKDMEEAIKHSAALLDFKGKCGMCGKSDIKLNTRTSKDKKYTYLQFTCNDCGGVQPIGKLQAGGYFLKTWQEKFKGNDENSDSSFE